MNNVTTKAEAKSSFVVIKKDKDGNEVFRSAETFNQITDYCYQQLFGIGLISALPINGNITKYLFRYLRLGKGTTEITPSSLNLPGQTVAIDGHKGGTPNNVVENVTIGGELYRKMILTFMCDLGQFNSETFTQLGIFSGTGANTLMCGQLIKDTLGNPSPITVLIDEQLVIKYTLWIKRIVIGDSLGGFNFNYAGTDYSTVVTAGSNLLGNVIANHEVVMPSSGSNISLSEHTTVRTVYENRVEYTFTHPRTITQSTSGISSLRVLWRNSSGSNVIIVSFDSPLPKTDQNTLSFTWKWTVKWRDL